jgi:membrane protease YdiL (CAAX protease family)
MSKEQPLTSRAGTPKSARRAQVNLAVFATVVVGIGWVGVAIDRASGAATGTSSATSTSGSTTGQGLWILVPALAALGLYYLRPDAGGPLGLTFRFEHRGRWLTLATVLFPAVMTLTVLVGIALGLSTLHVNPLPGKPTLLASIFAGLGFLTIKNVVEEFIFRGYGTRTARAAGLRGATPHVLIGLVWGLWHLPLYLVWTPASDRHMVTTLGWLWFWPMFFVGVVLLAIVLGELRVRTGSIWPGVVLHTVGSAIAAPLLANGHLTFSGHADALVGIQPSSVASMLTFGVVALALLKHRSVAGVKQP